MIVARRTLSSTGWQVVGSGLSAQLKVSRPTPDFWKLLERPDIPEPFEVGGVFTAMQGGQYTTHEELELGAGSLYLDGSVRWPRWACLATGGYAAVKKSGNGVTGFAVSHMTGSAFDSIAQDKNFIVRKTKAHRTMEQAQQECDLQSWKGNDKADNEAKGRVDREEYPPLEHERAEIVRKAAKALPGFVARQVRRSISNRFNEQWHEKNANIGKSGCIRGTRTAPAKGLHDNQGQHIWGRNCGDTDIQCIKCKIPRMLKDCSSKCIRNAFTKILRYPSKV